MFTGRCSVSFPEEVGVFSGETPVNVQRCRWLAPGKKMVSMGRSGYARPKIRSRRVKAKYPT